MVFAFKIMTLMLPSHRVSLFWVSRISTARTELNLILCISGVYVSVQFWPLFWQLSSFSLNRPMQYLWWRLKKLHFAIFEFLNIWIFCFFCLNLGGLRGGLMQTGTACNSLIYPFEWVFQPGLPAKLTGKLDWKANVKGHFESLHFFSLDFY